MDTRLKVAFSEIARGSGLLLAIERLIGRDKRLVLTLHRVLCKEEAASAANPHLVLTDDVFDGLLQLLCDRFEIVSLRELVDTGSKHLGKRRCAITFDDGWEDNHRVALPILKKYAVPATVFLATGYVGSTKSLPEDRLREAWKNAELKGDLVRLRDLLSAHSVSGLDLHHVHRAFKRLEYAKKLPVLDEAEQFLGVTASNRTFMTWDEVRAMAAADVTFESHTVNHVLLGVESSAEQIASELAISKSQIQEEIGRKPTMFAYPSGSFDRASMKRVADAGYLHAFTTQVGAVTSSSAPFALPRVAIDDSVLVDSAGRFRSSRASLHLVRHLGTTAPGPLA